VGIAGSTTTAATRLVDIATIWIGSGMVGITVDSTDGEGTEGVEEVVVGENAGGRCFAVE
jgi:hypothetical protein